MFEAYVLIDSQIGKAEEIAHDVREMDEVLHADVVTGCYDVLARIRADSPRDLGRIVNAMHSVDGVTRTQICPVVHESIAAHRGWQPLHAAV
ncbi:MAG TPA: Lrp/AsnC ligand binding domain-containing protein [Actinomycetota bacterium]